MKTLLTIGAGPGIGFATATHFARQGFHLVLASRNVVKLQVHAERHFGTQTPFRTKRVDASNPRAVAALVSGTDADVLHYNVGALRYHDDGSLRMDALPEIPTDDLSSDIQMNLSSALVAIQAALPGMLRRGSGTILLTGGGLAIEPRSDLLTLSAGKAGLRAAALALFAPLRKQGIHLGLVTVSALVDPGSDASRAVAELFWNLHAQPLDRWECELAYR